ncbi:hypothetical protein [Maricaulis parjimensis]|uniref:hypothetical protein n=1 Tax=Maricaulis parjimensis TaxID=144023 RepID=UPI001939F6D7|nr:hypothetical protein [Maricaulis parjimensis]
MALDDVCERPEQVYRLPGVTARLRVAEPDDPSSPPVLAPEPQAELFPARGEARNPLRKPLSRSACDALVRDLRRLSETCHQADLERAAALIEVAALVVDIQARFCPEDVDMDEEPDDFGLL